MGPSGDTARYIELPYHTCRVCLLSQRRAGSAYLGGSCVSDDGHMGASGCTA